MKKSYFVFPVLVLAMLGGGLFWLVGGALIKPTQRMIGASPIDLGGDNISIIGASGYTIHGWKIKGDDGHGVVLLLHGVRSDRRSMIGRARFLHRLGYNVLMIDMQAHGETLGPFITFGALESQDVMMAVEYIKQVMPQESVAVIGVSLGGAAFVLADVGNKVQAVVLESMYPTIDEALEDRLTHYLGTVVGQWLAPLLLWQFEWRTAITPQSLRPIDHIAGLNAPLLLLHGTADYNTTVAEAQRLFARAHEPKAIWLVPQAAHVDLHAFAPQEYERRVSDFLERNLKKL
jgi:fermentation-respiration switch protein FrsA (DUF1100 family)